MSNQAIDIDFSYTKYEKKACRLLLRPEKFGKDDQQKMGVKNGTGLLLFR